ncbi:efflux RND transporter periplasmic adaptor subunit [Acidithiobacillus sp. IBUN Pt1247-S3]|uniref:efflux RND transporter periplasmic adaptor subunit n=1 Tax=Acidithiobacillus sp. IBUN Pt1247-S3 TaxID=3166642 RepID=UPI0034E54408
MKKAFLLVGIALVLLVVVVGGSYFWRQRQLHAALQAAANPLVTVSATKAEEKSVAPEATAVGQVVAQAGAVLSLQTAGVITGLEFHSGQAVQAGQTLLQVNPGALPGQLQEARAQAALAQSNFARAQKVYAIHGISTAALDKAQYDAAAAAGKVQALQDELANTQLRAPFAGVLGLRQVNVGQYLTAGSPVVSLENLQALSVDFTLPQRSARTLHPGAQVTVQIHDGDRVEQYDATVTAVSSHVDADNRALALRARIAKPTGLKPGMYVQVRLQQAAPQAQVMIPTVAVSFHSYGDFVYVLKPGPKHTLIAHEQPVETGSQVGQMTVIRSGLQAGDEVVTAGQVKLRNGDAVRINNAVTL